MPYCKQKEKEIVAKHGASTAGQLNYEITLVVRNFWRKQHHRGYAALNDIIGALEGAKLEFYRRVAVPYEELKCELNGDVYYEETRPPHRGPAGHSRHA